MLKITKEEKDALYQYTMGDAYATINALLYPGMENEKAKKKEGKRIVLEDENTLWKHLNMILLMYSAMYKKFKNSPSRSAIYTRRIDRLNSLEGYRKNIKIFSNLSTTKNDFLQEYASKEEPVFLKVKLLPEARYADMEEILGEKYEKNQKQKY